MLPPAFSIEALAPFETERPSTLTLDSICVSPNIFTLVIDLPIILFSFNVLRLTTVSYTHLTLPTKA